MSRRYGQEGILSAPARGTENRTGQGCSEKLSETSWNVRTDDNAESDLPTSKTTEAQRERDLKKKEPPQRLGGKRDPPSPLFDLSDA